MQINASAIFTAVKEDPKQAKELIKSASTNSLLTHKTVSQKTINATAMQNADKALDEVFDKVKTGSMSKEQAVKTVQNSSVFKSESTTTNTLKELASLVSKEPTLEKYAKPLQEFSKDISTADGKNLKSQVTNSGVGMEAKLANASKEPSLSSEVKTVLKDIVKEQSVVKNLEPTQKEQIVKTANELLNAKEVYKSDVKELRSQIADVLKNTNLSKADTNVKNLIQNLNKLDNILEKMQNAKPQTLNSEVKAQIIKEPLSNQSAQVKPQTQNMQQNQPTQNQPTQNTQTQKPAAGQPAQNIQTQKPVGQNIEQNTQTQKPTAPSQQNIKEPLMQEKPVAQESIKQPVQSETQAKEAYSKPELTTQNFQANKKVQVLLKDIVQTLQSVQKSPEMPKEQSLQFDNLRKDMQVLTKSLSSEKLNENEVKVLQNISVQATTQGLIQTSQIKDLNVQDKLKMMSAKLQQSIEILDKQSLQTNHKSNNLKSVLQNLDNSIKNLPTKADGGESLKQDIKQTLTNIKEQTQNATTSNQKEIHNLANKTLTNIEVNQLISFANNTINTYVPYAWENLKDGSVAFKSGKEEDFYCQLDLDFKVYGRINMMLMLTNDSYINISVSTEKEEFGQKIEESLPELKQALNKAGLIPLNVGIKPYEDKSGYDDGEWSKYSMNLRV